MFRAASRSPQTPSPASRGGSRPIAGRSARASTCSAPTRGGGEEGGPRGGGGRACRGVARGHRRPRQLRPPLELVPPAGARVRTRPRRGSVVGGARSPRGDCPRRVLPPVRGRQRAVVPPPRPQRPPRARGRVAHPRGARWIARGCEQALAGPPSPAATPSPSRSRAERRSPCGCRRLHLEPPTPAPGAADACTWSRRHLQFAAGCCVGARPGCCADAAPPANPA